MIHRVFSLVNNHFAFRRKLARVLLPALFVLSLAACEAAPVLPTATTDPNSTPAPPTPIAGQPSPTPLPTRPPYGPGDLADYIAQDGDTLPALAAHFNTSVAAIRAANPGIPNDATTMPPGMPMKMPITYQPLWGSPYQIIPDSLFVNGPAQVGFDTAAFVKSQPGWFKNYHVYAGGAERYGGDLIDNIATNFSISPRLLLAVMEYQTGALSNPTMPDPMPSYPLGYVNVMNQGLYNQLLWAANTLNNGYYAWKEGKFKSFEYLDGRLEYPDPWQNAATIALHHYYSLLLRKEAFVQATHAQGLAATYTRLFGDPWANLQPHMPVSLYQPQMSLPFLPGKTWAYTGGPHTNWGEGDPLTSIDFAPPTDAGGCNQSEEWATAMADGVIARVGEASVSLDLDGDGDERTGWVVFYLHLAQGNLPRQGTAVKTGDPLGHPSCEGGKATGTHVHIARKYNGEWIPADGPLAFDLEGWIAADGAAAYEGSLKRFSQTVYANANADGISHIQSQVH